MTSEAPDDPSRKNPRARRPREELRQRTLEAARQIILDEGPEALTARKLAKAAGYTPGTIYNLFDSLPDVLWEVNREHFARMSTLFSNLPGEDPQTRLRNLAVRYLDLIEKEPTLFRALFDGPRRSETFPDWYLNAISALLDSIASELMLLSPGLSKTDAHRESVAMFTAIQGIASLHASGRLDLLTQETAATLADGLVTRILRDLSRGEDRSDGGGETEDRGHGARASTDRG
ncbi:DNA-binding transcriptional regulator, AcrR family [Paracoccus isoporae]|uniref:DNA-binding transcriptional regulator, AcrR family n=1 Tax=Paracoccus isoporae TaxID=591205 RepID=A0A1G7AIR0_9RHOB|nr:TetR/AcrR family transcriptional regulator [Paracoccus isoporae]SDE13756.1 DNA-binding transcriptional regulator, AcrR family [Paracoccus isoporae]